MSMYYDRQGNEISRSEWSDRYLVERRVEWTTLQNGKIVSTVWLGLDHQYGNGPPLIFETMVFPKEGEWIEIDCERYSTLEEAQAGHAAMVAKWSKDA